MSKKPDEVDAFEQWKASRPTPPDDGLKIGRPYEGGLHKVTKTLRDGSKKTYWYAYRGGPRLSAEESEFIRQGFQKSAEEAD